MQTWNTAMNSAVMLNTNLERYKYKNLTWKVKHDETSSEDNGFSFLPELLNSNIHWESTIMCKNTEESS